MARHYSTFKDFAGILAASRVIGASSYAFKRLQSLGRKAVSIAYTLIETAKQNTVDPHALLADALARIADYMITKVDDLMPGKWRA